MFLRSSIIELLTKYPDKVIFKVLFDSRGPGESGHSRHASSQKISNEWVFPRPFFSTSFGAWKAAKLPQSFLQKNLDLDLFREVLDEVCESFGDEKENLASKSLVSIKNLMSDRCATQKKFNDLFIEFRKNVLPHTIKNSEQQKKWQISGTIWFVWLIGQKHV